jgi:peptidoglycan biosynthesis protein MviN/MurJ (putative lipid II flippase)
VSIFTLASRVTGLVRELLIASMFGASALTDAFNVAFRIPNLFRRLFAEGAFSQAFVPVLAATRAQHGDEATKEVIDSVATALAWSLLALSVLGVLVSPWLVWATLRASRCSLWRVATVLSCSAEFPVSKTACLPRACTFGTFLLVSPPSLAI